MHMRSRPFAGMLFLVLCATRVSHAQASLGPEHRDLLALRGDIWANLTAPLHISRSDAVPLAIAVSAFAASMPFDSSIRVWMATHPTSAVVRVITPFREQRTIPLRGLGTWEYVIPLSAAAYATGRFSRNAGWRDAGLGCAATHLSSASLREIIYLGVSRARPNSTSDPLHISVPGKRSWDDHSFLSGHIANSMACASFVSHRFHTGYATPAMYAYAAAIGAGRMADGWHWTSDAATNPLYGFDRFAIAPYLSRWYPRFTPYGGTFAYDPAYYTPYVDAYQDIRLPTVDMVQRALPEGVLSPAARQPASSISSISIAMRNRSRSASTSLMPQRAPCSERRASRSSLGDR
jgi:hypothetical protein